MTKNSFIIPKELGTCVFDLLGTYLVQDYFAGRARPKRTFTHRTLQIMIIHHAESRVERTSVVEGQL